MSFKLIRETDEQKIARLERALRAIAEIAHYVQCLVEDVLDGGEAECIHCGTVAHDGPCVGEDDPEAPPC